MNIALNSDISAVDFNGTDIDVVEFNGVEAWKQVLIPHKTTASHGAGVKGAIRFGVGSRPISQLAG